jgi:hypothetical protein
MSWRPTIKTIACIKLASDVQPCLRRDVRGAGDLQHRRIFDFPSERESNAYVLPIDGHTARIYRIWIAMLTPVSPEATSGQI